jgi:hypothetical protein
MVYLPTTVIGYTRYNRTWADSDGALWADNTGENMNAKLKKRLQKRGWKVGDAKDFLKQKRKKAK